MKQKMKQPITPCNKNYKYVYLSEYLAVYILFGRKNGEEAYLLCC